MLISTYKFNTGSLQHSLPDALPVKCLIKPPLQRSFYATGNQSFGERPFKQFKPMRFSTPKSAKTQAKRKKWPPSRIISNTAQEQSLRSSETDNWILNHSSEKNTTDELEDLTKNASWKLTSILSFNGCTAKCAKTVHQLNEHEN